MIIQICIVIIAVAFVILTYALVQTLKSLRGTLEETKHAIGQLRTEVTQISADVKEAVHHTNAMTLDVRTKLSALDSVFASVSDIGHAIHSFTGAAKQTASSIAVSMKKESARPVKEPGIVSMILDGIISGVKVWNKIKTR